jgi:hypothetical protein
MTCRHTRTIQVGPDRCFTGPVARDENRAAHGNICATYECVDCGARRAVNINGRHIEHGPFGPSRAHRDRLAREATIAARAAVAAVAPLELTRGDERCTLRVDDEAFIIVPAGCHWPELAPLVVRSSWFERVSAARAAVLAASTARSEVG